MFLLFPTEALIVDQKKRAPKKNKKLYFTDPFIFNCLWLKVNELLENPFTQSQNLVNNRDRLPSLAENLVAAQLKRVYASL